MRNLLRLGAAGTALCLAGLASGHTLAAAPATNQKPSESPVQLSKIEVTATPVPEQVGTVPKSVQIITHAQLERMGATNLRTALSLVGGVYIAPGGDGGPAGSVPQFQGLQEFDAFLLLVDGVPWGGAFNPDLPSIDLNDVARIEVIRGAAPVKYGATSFVGIINIIHRATGDPTHTLSASVGSWDSGSVSFATPITTQGPFKQSLAVDASSQGMRDYRAGYNRQHLLYRSTFDTENGVFHLDFDAMNLHQQPQSPIPLDAASGGLSPYVPVDSNQNPSNSEINTERYQVNTGYDAQIGNGTWSTTLVTTFKHQRNVRGFLRADAYQTGGTPNSDGYNQSVSNTGIYLDSHYTYPLGTNLQMVTGFNYLYGWGQENSNNYEYYVQPNGGNPPNSNTLHVDEQTQLEDRRSFFGAYSQADWTFAPSWDLQAGLRLNRTMETSNTALWPATGTGQPQHNSASQTNTRFSGQIALSKTLWDDNSGRAVAYASYGNTFKPAAVDFGPEYQTGILQPETAQSYQAGLKGYVTGPGLGWDMNLFWVNFSNVVIPANVGGLPGTQNGGQQRLRGIEAELDGRLFADWRWTATYSYHEAQYTNFAVNEGGNYVQLAGNMIVMSPRHLFKAGVSRMPSGDGWLAYANLEIVGTRYYDMNNQIQAPGYGTLNAGVGYRLGNWTVRLDGTNLTNRRVAVAESELGPDSFYVMPARAVTLGATLTW
ncbi:MAG: TonB-dependent receptor [Gammaproteobacteria bacterium]